MHGRPSSVRRPRGSARRALAAKDGVRYRSRSPRPRERRRRWTKARELSVRRPQRRKGHTVTTARGSFVVVNRLGLHARAAAKLTQLASRFPCEVSIRRDGQSANAKSVMGVLLLCGAKGTELEVEAVG